MKSGNKTDLFEVNFTADMEARLDEVKRPSRVDADDGGFYPSLLSGSIMRERTDVAWVARCLEALSHVQSWADPVKTAKRP